MAAAAAAQSIIRSLPLSVSLHPGFLPTCAEVTKMPVSDFLFSIKLQLCKTLSCQNRVVRRWKSVQIQIFFLFFCSFNSKFYFSLQFLLFSFLGSILASCFFFFHSVTQYVMIQQLYLYIMLVCVYIRIHIRIYTHTHTYMKVVGRVPGNESFIGCIHHIRVLEEFYPTIFYFSVIGILSYFKFFPWNLKELLLTELLPDISFFGVVLICSEWKTFPGSSHLQRALPIADLAAHALWGWGRVRFSEQAWL